MMKKDLYKYVYSMNIEGIIATLQMYYNKRRLHFEDVTLVLHVLIL